MKRTLAVPFFLALVLIVFGCATPLTPREKAAAVGAVGGAVTGGLIGGFIAESVVGVGIGSIIGLGAGGMVGEQLQARQKKEAEQQPELEKSWTELEREEKRIEDLKKQRRNLLDTKSAN